MNDTYGGAVAFMDSENPTVQNCIFINNYAQSQTGTSYGGSIYATSGILISNSNFTNNRVRSYSLTYGGAIVIFRNSQIINSNFINNLADGSDGNAGEAGAIYHLGDALTIRNSTFNNNEVRGKDESHGGAISDATSLIYIYDSTFSNNKVDSSSNSSYGGALYLQSSQLQSYNTIFDNNTITGYLNSYGGAIYSDYELIINNNTFTNNKVKSEKNTYGGAIVSATPVYMQVEVQVINSKLNNNIANSTASNSYGGAISITGSILTITGTSFENNMANSSTTSYGGAIQTDILETTQPILNMNNVTFNNNTATSMTTSYGGAISTTGTNTNANNTTFTNNKAQSINYGSYGGALSTTGQSETIRSNVIIANSSFTNNTINATTRGYGGAISITASDLRINNTNFTDNTVNSTKSNSYGGAIATTGESITQGSIVNIDNAIFTNNIANSTDHYSYGGAVAITGTNITINNTQFNRNIANSTSYGSYGGAVATTGESETRNSNMTIENSIFTNNIATGNVRNYGGAISTTGSNLNITKSRFTNNTVNSRISNSYGGAIATTGESETRNSNVTITDTTFNDNHARSTERSYGGAISITGSNINLTNTNFTNNIANSTASNSYGGAIATTGESTVFSASININNTKFENNLASGYGKTYGGAISTTGTNTTLNNNTFINNTANSTASNSYGGAIATTGESETRNSNITITNTEFKNNTASGNIESYGGAISTIGSSLAIDTVNFTQNKAEAKTDNSYGGAISTTGESEIKNSDITITNSNFTNNSISSRIRSYGGAISGINQNLKVNLTNFTDNQATSSSKSYGGAISIMSESTTLSSTLNISNVTFANNKANGSSLSYGGAIAITGANLTLTNSTLDKNSATSTNTSYGGAIATTGESEIRNSNLTVSYTTFLNNTSKIGGGIYGKNNILNLTFSAFNNNTAENSVNLADENVTLILRGNYFAQVDSIYDSNITAQVNGNNAVALLNQTTPSPLKVVLVEKDSNQTITKLGNNYMLEVSSIPDDLITKVNLTVENGYSSDVEFKPLPADSNMKVYTEYTLVAIMNHDANLTISVTTPVNTVGNVTANVDVTENGNPVNGNVIFTINGETYNVTIVDGKAQLNYTLPSDIEAGEYDVSAEFTNPMYNTKTVTGTFTVVKLDIENTTIDETIKTLENFTINTIVKDTNGNPLVGTNNVTVEINGETIKTTITDGVLDITLPTDTMEANTYTFTVNIEENNLYNAGKITGTLTIQKRDADVTIDVTTPVNTVGNVTANVDVTENANPVNGNVIFTINGETYNVTIVDGKAQLNYTLPSDIEAGEYDVSAEFTNPMYNTKTVTGTFTVVKLDIENTTMDETIKAFEDFTINTIVKDTNGNTLVGTNNVIVVMNNETLIKTTITDGVLNIVLPTGKMNTNINNFTITIEGNNLYNAGQITGTLTIEPTDADMTIDVTTPVNTIGNVTATVTVSDNGKPVNGNIIFTINGETYNVTIVDGKAQLNYTLPSDIQAGEYDVVAELENPMYNAKTVTGTFSVVKLDIANTTMEGTIKTQENYTINTVIKDTNGNTLIGTNDVTIQINGQTIKTTITDGVLDITLPTDKMEANTYPFTVNIEENNIYNAGKITGTLTIQKCDADLTIDVTTPVNTIGTVTANVTVSDNGKPVDGNVIFTINGETYNVTVVDGKAQLNYTLPSDIQAGEYDVVAELENPMYNANTVTGKFTVIKINIPDTTMIGTIKTLENYTINTIIKDANGNTLIGTNDVTVEINGQTVKTTITNGVLNIVLPTDKMEANTYPFTVNIEGNNLYNAGQITGILTIQKRDTNMTIDVTTPVNTIGTVTANVTVSDNGKPVDGNVIFTINGETYNVTVVDGKAQLNYTLPSDIQAGEYDVVAELESPMYDANPVTGKFTVIKLDIANTTINGTIKTFENYTINTIIKDTNGNTLIGTNDVTVEINGQTIKTTITDGILNITLPTDTMEAKTYPFTVNIGENNIYNAGKITGTLTIQKRDSNITMNVTTPVNITGTLTANVTVTDNGKPVNGNVIFKVDNETFNVTIVDGKAQLNYTLPSDIQAGEHNITAELENPMYNANNVTGNFTVLKINIANTTIEETIKTLENYTLNTIIKDANGNQLVGVNQIAVKMNGKTFMHGTITDGVLNITFPTDSMEAKVYNLTIIIGENNIYKTGQITGKLTIQRRDVTVKVEVNNPYTLSDLLANVTVTENGILMKDGAVIFKINGLTLKDENGNEIMANVINGHASLNYTLSYKYSAYPSTSTGMNNFTAVYINNYYNANSDTVDFKITPTTIPDMKFDNINILTGENTTINITVRDINNKTIVANKKIAVKINGKTIIHDNITDGKIYLNIPTDQLAKGQYNLLIIIGTNSIYSNASYTMIIDIQKRNASIETQAFTNGKTLSLVTKVTSNESFIDENVVIYKLNGVTLKDEDGNIIKVNVKNGLASLDYELPGITTAINYNLTSVYVNNFYYNRCEEVETISIPKIAIPSISLNDSIISKGQNLSISTTLKDAYNDTLKGLSNIDIKINGNNVMKTSIMNGKLNITIPTDKLKAGNYEIIIIIKEGSKYFGTVDLMNLKVAT